MNMVVNSEMIYANLLMTAAKLQFEVKQERLRLVIVFFNEKYKGNVIIKNKIETLIDMTKKEMQSLRRMNVIDDYLEEIEDLLQRYNY